MRQLDIKPGQLPPECESLRNEVRTFIAANLADRSAEQKCKSWTGFDPVFSQKMAAHGWIGMTWPESFGGGGRSPLERYVVLEELLAAGAPMGAHWVGDRQSGALLMHFSPNELAPEVVPKIVRGEAVFCIGMSEPDSGSDLASIRTRAVRKDGGWVINGRKLWTTNAHLADYMIALVRTSANETSRHAGMSQFLIDMKTPGITVRPIITQDGEHDFNEVTLDDVWVAERNLIGTEGDGWKQVTTELSFERSGPERYLSSTQLLLEMLDSADANDQRHSVALGRMVAHYATLRQMSLGVTCMLANGEDPSLAASAVKDQGALLEQAMPDLAHDLFGGLTPPDSDLAKVMKQITLNSPAFSLRGGTREILRAMLAKGMGLR